MSERLTVGLLYDRPEDYPWARGPEDRFAEFEPESTLQAMEDALQHLGHASHRIGSPMWLLEGRPQVDIIWNIAEGYGTRNREAWAPVLCEIQHLPYLGSDAHTLSQTLDKVATKLIARHLEIPTPEWTVYPAGRPVQQPPPSGAASSTDRSVTPGPGQRTAPLSAGPVPDFPVFIKPRYEGTAKGISATSLIVDSATLDRRADELAAQYGQDVLIERFLPGAEFTGMLYGNPLLPLPVLERGLHRATGIGIHAMNESENQDYTLTHELPASLEQQITEYALRICRYLEVYDFVRLDFKQDESGVPNLLEINPLPTFGVDSTFAIVAELENRSYTELLADIIAPAIQRVCRDWDR